MGRGRQSARRCLLSIAAREISFSCFGLQRRRRLELIGCSLNLRVLPPFWQTWWFTALGGLAVIGGGGSTVRYWSVRRLRHKLAALEQQHALEKERARIARDIHDELGANLTRITLLTELGQKHQARPEEVAADLTKISATAREAVRAMDAIVWAVNPRNDSLDHFANHVSLFAEDFLRLTPIRCRLDIPANLPERFLSTVKGTARIIPRCEGKR